MQIRKMTEKDVAAVAELEKDCFSRPWGAQEIEESLKKDFYVFLVAEEKDAESPAALTGYISMYRVLDEGDITEVAVRRTDRRRGIGESLLKELISVSKALGLTSLTLEVRDGNLPASALYEKLGFKQIGLRKRYYEDPEEDARIYALAL